MSPMPRRWFALLGGLCLALAACAGPVGTTRVDSKTVLRNLGRSAVATGEPSLSTRNVLFERGLFEAFDERSRGRDCRAAPGDGRVAGEPGPALRSCRAVVAARPGDHEAGLLPGGRRVRLRLPLPRRCRGRCPGAVRPARSDRGGSVQLDADRGVHVRRTRRRSSRVAVRSCCPSAGSRWHSTRRSCVPGTASCTGSSPSRSWRSTASRCGIAGRGSALRSPPPPDPSTPRNPAGTWWPRACRCR